MKQKRYIPSSIKAAAPWGCEHTDAKAEYHHVLPFSLLASHKYLVKLCHACHRKWQFVKPKVVHLDDDIPCFCDACQGVLRNDAHHLTYRYEGLGFQFYICRKCFIQWESSIDYYRDCLANRSNRSVAK